MQKTNSPLLLGQRLVNENFVSLLDVEKALQIQDEVGGKIGTILIRLGALSEDNLFATLAMQQEILLLSYADFPVDYEKIKQFLKDNEIDVEWIQDQQTVVWKTESDVIVCISEDPLNNSVNEYFEAIFPEKKLEWCIAFGHDIERFIERLLEAKNILSGDRSEKQLREMAEEAPVIEFVNNLITKAFERRASDIHIEPEELNMQIRIRVDGILYNLYTLSVERFNAIASRIKLVSGMDIAEYRIPQDGQMETRVGGVNLDIRISTLPSVYGESIVMRLLPKENHQISLDQIGLSPENLTIIKSWIDEPHGIILVTGPTGSGKSTTLYALLSGINNNHRKIITVENPVEYRLQGITQVQVKEEIGYTFANALRAILRQDPDVIMVGEIRDTPTADISIQASLTGHLVLSTLHTNDAVSAFTRLIDMGVEPFLVATPIKAVMAQRLVRKLCTQCSKAMIASENIESLLPDNIDWKQAAWKQAIGCEDCQDTGYSGRIAIHEIVVVTSDIRQAIIDRKSTDELRFLLQKQGFKTLKQDGIIKAFKGITSIDEIFRVTST